MRTPRIETQRLILREIREQDMHEIFECWMKDEAVSRYMLWKARDNIGDCIDFVEYELGQIENGKWFRWIIVLKQTGEVVGTCLIFLNEDDEPSHWDISYCLGKRYWGMGYATEAMEEVLRFARKNLGMTECITTYAKANQGSANVLKKLGFKDEKEISYKCNGGEIVTEGMMCRYTAKDF